MLKFINHLWFIYLGIVTLCYDVHNNVAYNQSMQDRIIVQIKNPKCSLFVCLFVWFDSLRPINNLSVIKGLVFLGRTSTKLGLMFLLKDIT